jgi:nitroreductase
MGVQSVAMAGENILLSAHALGLGGVWICAPLFAARAVTRTLALPENWQPQGLLLLGYPDAIPPARSRQAWAELTITR